MRDRLKALGLGLGLLYFVIALLCLWLAMTMVKPFIDFSEKCQSQGGTVVHGTCLDLKELQP